MALRFATAGTDVEAAFREGLGRSQSRRERAGALGGAAPDQFFKTPLPVYACSLDALLQEGSGCARQSGWRYLLARDRSVVETADVVDDGKGGAPPVFRGATRGGTVIPKLDQALHAIEGYASGAGQFELRILQIPALYIVALWLSDEGGGEDLFVDVTNLPLRVQKSGDFWGATLVSAQQALVTESALKLDSDK